MLARWEGFATRSVARYPQPSGSKPESTRTRRLLPPFQVCEMGSGQHPLLFEHAGREFIGVAVGA
jgi:hypothetical protein